MYGFDVEDSLPAVNAQQISNSYFVNLDVSVLEVSACFYFALLAAAFLIVLRVVAESDELLPAKY